MTEDGQDKIQAIRSTLKSMEDTVFGMALRSRIRNNDLFMLTRLEGHLRGLVSELKVDD